MRTVIAMHDRPLEGSVYTLPDGRNATVVKACHIEVGDVAKTADHEGKVLAVQIPVGGGHVTLRFQGYGFEGTETLRSAELMVRL